MFTKCNENVIEKSRKSLEMKSKTKYNYFSIDKVLGKQYEGGKFTNVIFS